MDSIKRKKIIISALVGLLVIIALIIAFTLTDYGQKKDDPGDEDLPVFQAPSANLEYKDLPPPVTDSELGAIQAASNFAERFGTYSSDLPGENIKQLLGQCTDKMATYLSQMEIDYQAKEFTGVTTKSISNKIIDLSNNQAEILVQTQRQESKKINDQVSVKTLYQDIKINLVKSEQQWLVDAAYWQ
jgi:hypothetical protein